MSVVILRGVSGAGKSTWAKRRLPIDPLTVILSADDFFMKDGEYLFDWRKLSEAHGKCLREFTEFVQDRMSIPRPLIVDNTNTTVVEIAPYMALAQAYGREARIITFLADPDVAAKRNTHGVDVKKAWEMHGRLVKEQAHFPKWWKHTIEVEKV